MIDRPADRISRQQPESARFAVAALLVANVALACGPWLVRLAEVNARVGPVGSAFWRVAIALPILLVATRQVGEARPARWLPVVLAGLIAGIFFAADLAAWHLGILHTRLANATLLGNVTALLFPLYGFVATRHWPSGRQGIALALAGAGVLLLLGRSYELSSRNIAGDLLCIVAGLFYTLYLIGIDRVRGQLGPVTTLTLTVIAAAPALLLAALLSGDPIRPHDWTPLVLLAVGSQIVGQGLILYAVGRVPPLVVGLMLLVQPIVAATIGWFVYGERLTGFDAVGALAIAAAVLLVRDGKRPSPPRGLGPDLDRA